MMLVSEAGKAISVRAVQRTKAANWMLVTPAGRVISVRDVLSLDAASIVIFTLALPGAHPLSNDEQFWKA